MKIHNIDIEEKKDKYAAITVFVVFFAIYLFTLCKDVTWGDSAKLALQSNQFEFQPEAGRHPLRALVGTLFDVLPMKTVGYRQNLMSALFGSLSLVVLYLLLKGITGSVASALALVFAFGLSHIQWHLSVITESYTLTLFIILLMLYHFWKYTLDKNTNFVFVFAFLAGLGLANFLLIGILVSAIAVWLVGSMRMKLLNAKLLLLAVLLFLFGALPLLVGVIVRYEEFGGLEGTVTAVLDLRYSDQLFIHHPGAILKGIGRYLLFLGYQFPSPVYLLGFIGMAALFRRRKGRGETANGSNDSERLNWWDSIWARLNISPFVAVLIIFFVLMILFTSTYMMQRAFFIMHPSFAIFVIFAAYAFTRLKGRVRRAAIVTVWLFALAVPFVYYIVPESIANAEKEFIFIRKLPYRDNVRFYLQPWKHNENGAIRYAKECFEIADERGVILADFTPGAVLEYYATIGQNQKRVEIKPIYGDYKALVNYLEGELAHRRIYLADNLAETYHIDKLFADYELVELFPLYEIKMK